MRLLLSLASLLSVVGYVCAHGADEHMPTTTEELIARNVSAIILISLISNHSLYIQRDVAARDLAARKCSTEIAEFEAQRIAKRDRLMKRQWTPTSTAPTPHYTSIQNVRTSIDS